MGRTKKYTTQEELITKQREYSKKYYWSNKLKIDESAKQRYRANKSNSLPTQEKT